MSTGSVSRWLEGLARGDARAQEAIWERYFERLVQLARRRLRAVRPGARDEEDVALVAMNSFLRRAAAGGFPRLNDREDLWKILVTITGCRALDQQKREERQKRPPLCGESALGHNTDSSAEPAINWVIGREPTPEFAAMVAEQCEQLLEQLGDPALRILAQRRLEGYTVEEIAQELGCALRTVKRRLDSIRTLWSREVTNE